MDLNVDNAAFTASENLGSMTIAVVQRESVVSALQKFSIQNTSRITITYTRVFEFRRDRVAYIPTITVDDCGFRVARVHTWCIG